MPVVAVLVGLQASGKSTFCSSVLAGYVQVSKDQFPNARNRQRRQLGLIRDALAAGKDVVVDNTNRSLAEWEPLVAAARQGGARVVAYWFPQIRMARRGGTLPARAGHGCQMRVCGRRWHDCGNRPWSMASTRLWRSGWTAQADSMCIRSRFSAQLT